MGGSKTTTSTKIPLEIRQRGSQITKAAMGEYFDPAARYQNYNYGDHAQTGRDTTGQMNGYHSAAGNQYTQAATGYQPYLSGANNAASAAQGNTAGTYAGPNFTNENIQRFQNPYNQNVIDAGVRQIGEAMTQGRLDNQSRAAMAGAFGGTRHAVLDSLNQQNAMTNLSDFIGTHLAKGYDNAVNQYNTDYSQGLQAQQLNNQASGQNFSQGMDYAKFLQGMGQQSQSQALASGKAFTDLGNIYTAQEQAQKDNAYEKGYLDRRNYPMEIYERLAAINAMQPVNRTSTSSQSGGWLGPAIGAVGSIMGSDVNMKENVVERDPEDVLGAFSEVKPYEYTYKEKAREANPDITAPGVRRGFMAQDYEKAFKRATGPTTRDGYKTVDLNNVIGDLVAAVHGLEKRTRVLKPTDTKKKA